MARQTVLSGVGGRLRAYFADTGPAVLTLPRDIARSGTLANRPTAGLAGRFYFATDDGAGTLYHDTGSAWELVTVGSGLQVALRTFTETTGAGTYTGAVAIPAGSIILDVLWHNTAVWTASTSATMKCGTDDDDDMFFTAVNVKSAPSADTNGAGGISSKMNDSGAGVAGGKTLYLAAAKTVTAVVTTVGASGSAGRSVLAVLYATPSTTSIAAAKA